MRNKQYLPPFGKGGKGGVKEENVFSYYKISPNPSLLKRGTKASWLTAS
jgi:hypothetical protein